MVAIIMMDFLAALISSVAISVNVMAPVIVTAKNHDAGRWWRHINRAPAIVNVTNATGKNSHRCHAKHGCADAENQPPLTHTPT